ncbi:MAG: glycosyltransferase family 4 protein [Pseudomonadota bacterium]
MSDPRKAKILFLVTEDWYFCSHRLPIARAARDAGMEVVVATRVSDRAEAIRAEGFRLLPIGLRRRSFNPFREVAALAELVRLYRRERPDLVHHVAMKPVLYGSFAAWLCGGLTAVNALAGLGFVFASSNLRARALRPFVRFALRFLLNRVNGKVVLQNPDDRRALQETAGIKPERMMVIPGSGVDTTHFQPLPEPPGASIGVAMVARMLAVKGVYDLIAAARLLARRDKRVRVLLYGMPDPDNPTSIPRAQLEAWTAEGIVEWRGFEVDVRRIWREAHIAVLPSYGEGVPKSLLEAAACGRPVVTTDAPGCREVVRPDETGLLVPPGEVEALAGALAHLAGDEALRRAMGEKGRRFIEATFSERLVVTQTMALYRELLARAR